MTKYVSAKAIEELERAKKELQNKLKGDKTESSTTYIVLSREVVLSKQPMTT